MSTFQMAEARKALMRLPPRSLSEPTCNAYSNRRCLPGIAWLLQPPATKEEQKALGNWLDRMDMAEHYSSTKTRALHHIKAKFVWVAKQINIFLH